MENVGVVANSSSSMDDKSGSKEQEVVKEEEQEDASSPSKAFPSWMGSWTKRTWKSAAKAQSQIGELLSRPGRKYKELSEENEALRERVVELSNSLGEKVVVSGECVCGQVQAVKGGLNEGVVIGTEQDAKLLTVRWFRRRADGSLHWQRISGAYGGFYRVSIDDVNCELRAQIEFSALYNRLAASVASSQQQTSASSTDGEIVNSASSVSLSSMASSQSGLDAINVTTEVITANPAVNVMIASEGGNTDVRSASFKVENKLDPLYQGMLKLEWTDKSLKVSVSRADEEEEEDGEVTDHESGDDFADGYPIAASSTFPDDLLQVCAHGASATGLRLVFKDISLAVDVFAQSNVERDCIVGLIRKKRKELVPEIHVDYDIIALPQDGDTVCTRRSSVSSFRQLTTETDPAYAGAYPQVWELLEFKLATPTTTPASPISPPQKSKMLSSVTSLLSSALDPLQAAAQSKGKPPLEDSPVEFDLYQTAGFGKTYDVDLDLKDGEGLGITLSLLHLVRKGEAPFPKPGATCVCVSEFCDIIVDGEECKGQLEKCGLIRRGDALVAINGMPVEQEPVKVMKDLFTYRPCTLGRVSKLVGVARHGNSTGDDRPTNPACKITFTFAQGQAGPAKVVTVNNKLKSQVEELRTKLYESNARLSTVVTQCEIRLEKQGARTRKLCEVVEEQRTLAERASDEKLLVAEECQTLKREIAALRDQLAEELAEKDEELAQEREKAKALEVAKLEAIERAARLEASVADMANEGEAWVNTIGTKEDALRAVESDLRASQAKADSLEQLLDNARAERASLKEKYLSREGDMDAIRAEVEVLKTKLASANDEADALTSRMRLEMDDAENEIQRAKHRNSTLAAELEGVRAELAVALTHATALKEASAGAEERAEEASKARQAAEIALAREKKLNEEKAKAVPITAPMAAPANGNSTKRVSELEGANELLRAQVRSLKAKVKSLADEVGKAAQFDAVVAEKSAAIAERDDLEVSMQLERAQRLEAEDELQAYKRALRQFAENAKKDEQNGKGEPWSNRPRIFDHLYKMLLSEDK